jgi:HEAT repeat protein
MFGPAQLTRSREAALRDVESDRPAVRVSAVRDLARHVSEDRTGDVVLALRTALSSDPSRDVRAAAAVAFADAEVKSAVEALLRAAEDRDVYVQQMALLALGELASLDHPRALETVSAALASAEPSLRFQALIATHKLGTSDAERALLDATSDSDPEVRHVALRLLEERATTEEDETRPSHDVLEAAAARLGDAAASVRLAAAILLCRAGDRRGDAVIAATVDASTDIDADDEQAAVVLAGELRLEGARKGLERRAFPGVLSRDRFSYEARIALALLGDARARRTIARGLSAWSRDARTLAVVAAGRAGLVEAMPTIVAMKQDPRRAEPEAVELALRLLGGAGA